MSIAEILAAAKDGILLEPETKRVLAAIGIETTTCYTAQTPADAIRIATDLGFPVAIKASSPKLLHKSDAGGVELDLRDADDVARAFERVRDKAREIDPQATITVQKMALPGTEVIIGVTTDTQFGKVIMFGLGGILTELLQDVAFRLLPIDEHDAREMISSIKAFPVLKGFRGHPPADIDALIGILLSISHLTESYPSIRELDLNPIIVYEKGAIVVDARAILGGSECCNGR